MHFQTIALTLHLATGCRPTSDSMPLDFYDIIDFDLITVIIDDLEEEEFLNLSSFQDFQS